MHAIATSEIVVPAILITAIAIVLCYVARKERREALDQTDKFGEIAMDFCKAYIKSLNEIEVLEKERDSLMETVGYQQQRWNARQEGSESISVDTQKLKLVGNPTVIGSASAGEGQPPQPLS